MTKFSPPGSSDDQKELIAQCHHCPVKDFPIIYLGVKTPSPGFFLDLTITLLNQPIRHSSKTQLLPLATVPFGRVGAP
jgi:hypothetical protein